MKATKQQAEKHLQELQKRNKNFKGGVVFCEVAKEWVVDDKGLHLHTTDCLDVVADWEKEIFYKPDLRKLDLVVCNDRVIYNPEDFVNTFKLHKEFKKHFNCDIENWEYDCCDEDVYNELLNYINKENKVYFIVWNENIDNHELYYITYGGD